MTTAASERRICTNKLLMDIIEFDKALFDTSNLSVDEIKYFNSIIDGFNNQTQFYIDWLDSDEARRIFYENEQYNDHTFAKIDEQIKEIVHDTSLKADEIISRIYDSGLQAGADEIKRTRYYNDATKYGLHFLQSYNFELISNVNDDLKNHIREEIFAGIAAGEGMPEVAKRILDATNHSLTGKTLSARQRAMMIARTESARAMTQGRLQSYANYGVNEVKILTAGDDNVCAICREAETKIYLIEDAGDLVPFHPLCRCSVMAYIRHGILVRRPLENPKFMDCTPNNKNDKVERPEIKWTTKSLRKQLESIADPEDLDNLTDEVMKYMYGLQNKNMEYLNAVDGEGNVICNQFTQNNMGSVDLCEKAKLVNNLFMVIHNHPGGNPYHSLADVEMFTLYNLKYSISFTENKGIKIFKNQNFKKFDDDSTYKINKIWKDIYQEIKDECYFVRKNEFNNVKKYSTNKARDNARIIDEYFIENLYRIVNTSNKQFSKYHVEVSYINP